MTSKGKGQPFPKSVESGNPTENPHIKAFGSMQGDSIDKADILAPVGESWEAQCDVLLDPYIGTAWDETEWEWEMIKSQHDVLNEKTTSWEEVKRRLGL